MEETTSMRLVLAKPTLVAAVAEGRGPILPKILMAEQAAAASCASGCIRKRNNKLKGERLCTTL